MSKTVIVDMEYEAPKKHSVRYKAKTSAGASTPALSTIYLSNKAYNELGSPKKLRILLETIDK